MKISLVIPTKNEAGIVQQTIKTAYEYLNVFFSEFELIIADDGSTDNTVLLAQRTGLAQVLECSGRGKGSAVRAGVLYADGDYIFFTDADLAYPLSMIEPALSAMEMGADWVAGNRRLGSDHAYPLLRRISSRCFELAADAILGLWVTDTQCGFKGFGRHAAKELFGRACIDGLCFDAEVYFLSKRLGLIDALIPAVMRCQMPSTIRIGTQIPKMLADLFAIRTNSILGKYDTACAAQSR